MRRDADDAFTLVTAPALGPLLLELLERYHFSEDLELLGPEGVDLVTRVGRGRRRGAAGADRHARAAAGDARPRGRRRRGDDRGARGGRGARAGARDGTRGRGRPGGRRGHGALDPGAGGGAAGRRRVVRQGLLPGAGDRGARPLPGARQPRAARPGPGRGDGRAGSDGQRRGPRGGPRDQRGGRPPTSAPSPSRCSGTRWRRTPRWTWRASPSRRGSSDSPSLRHERRRRGRGPHRPPRAGRAPRRWSRRRRRSARRPARAAPPCAWPAGPRPTGPSASSCRAWCTTSWCTSPTTGARPWCARRARGPDPLAPEDLRRP